MYERINEHYGFFHAKAKYIKRVSKFMKEEFKDIDRFEKYLSGKLTGNQLSQFKKSLRDNRAFANQFRNFKLSLIAINDYGRSEIKKKLVKIHNRSIKKKNLQSDTLDNLSQTVSNFIDKIFGKYFSPYENIVTVRSDRSKYLNEAMKQYSEGNYNNAVTLFKKILKDKPKDVYSLFYCGISLLDIGKYKEARTKFNKLLKIENNVFREQTEWYVGLTYLKSYDVNKAISIFEKLGTDSNEYNSAKKIIKNLRDIQ